MGKSVRELTESMDALEWSYWEALYETEPFGEERDDLRAGIVASSVANFSGLVKQPLSAIDFMPKFREGTAPQGVEQKIRSLMGQIIRGQ